MRELRSTFFSRLLAILTAVVFLNMSFFLTEIRSLDLQPDTMEILVKMISGSGFEEENDGLEESETGGYEQILDFNIVFTTQLALNNNLNSSCHLSSTNSNLFRQAYHEIATPPPKNG